MNGLPENLFANPVLHALRTKHRHFAESEGDAYRYPADVALFAALATPSICSLQSLHSLLMPGEYVWIIGERYPSVPGLSCERNLECLQMVLPEEVTPPGSMPASGPVPDIVPLSRENAPEMVALTTLAFPGFFRGRTCDMGSYYGIRSNGELIAMGGERIILDGYPEISGVCTHPAHRRNGHAANLIWQLVRDHRRDGLVSWLHVSAENHHAIELYLRLGFKVARKVKLHHIRRND
jgi:ribosomal protein S18 acetylase RimI-like enzyme